MVLEIHYMKQDVLSKVKSGLMDFADRYREKNSWMEADYGGDWALPTNIRVDAIELVHAGGHAGDLENVRRLYSALRGLRISQAVDERMWAYLSHGPFYGYVKKRWFSGQSELKAKDIKSRFFFGDSPGRSLVRNAISRLWWFGFATYDASRSNPFELTEVLLSKQRVAHDLMERGYARNRQILHTILQVFLDLYGTSISTETVRDIAKHLTFTGGVSLLDSLNEDDIADLILERAS